MAYALIRTLMGAYLTVAVLCLTVHVSFVIFKVLNVCFPTVQLFARVVFRKKDYILLTRKAGTLGMLISVGLCTVMLRELDFESNLQQISSAVAWSEVAVALMGLFMGSINLWVDMGNIKVRYWKNIISGEHIMLILAVLAKLTTVIVVLRAMYAYHFYISTLGNVCTTVAAFLCRFDTPERLELATLTGTFIGSITEEEAFLEGGEGEMKMEATVSGRFIGSIQRLKDDNVKIKMRTKTGLRKVE